MGYPVYKITATVKNIDLKTANNVAVKLNPSSEMTLIDGDESQTVETINSNETVTFSWTVKMDTTQTYSTRCEVTAKADNSVESKSYLTIPFDNDILGKDNRFDFKKDTWKFTNSHTYFNKGHFIKDSYFDSFFYNAPNTTAQKIRNEYFSTSKKDWNGSCYGMSIVAILDKLDIVDVTDYDTNATCVHDADSPKDNDDIYSLIEAYHFSQNLPIVRDAKSNFAKLSTNTQLHQLVDAVEQVKNGGIPVALGVNWYKSNVSRYSEKYETSGHRKVAYDVEFLENPTEVKNLVTKDKED